MTNEVTATEANNSQEELTYYKERKDPKIGVKEVEGRIVGRDKKVIPPEELEKLANIGCKDTEISNWFGIPETTLRYNFSAELAKGRESLKQSLRQAQIRLALSGNAVMLIWLGKNLLGQSDNPTDSDANQPLPWNEDD